MAASRFEDGNRHDVYKVSYFDPSGATEHVVVRVSYGGDPADCAQAEREATVLEKAGGIAVWARDPFPAAVQVRLWGAAHSVQRSWESARGDRSFSSGATLALLHGDPGPENILWGRALS
jgi:hypothetical protein